MAEGLEGTVAEFPDEDPTVTGIRKRRSGRIVTRILVRNVSGFTLLPKRAVVWKDGFRGRRVAGYQNTTAGEVAGIVDEHLPSSGVPNNDLFWLTVIGPTLAKNSLAGNAENVIAAGDYLLALTAASSGASTAGRVIAWNGLATLTETTDGNLTKKIVNMFGRAMSASTTANTDADILVDLFAMRR
jgi:hypothetical protein